MFVRDYIYHNAFRVLDMYLSKCNCGILFDVSSAQIW